MNNSQDKKTGVGAGSVIAISIIYVLLGLAMLFVPKIKEIYIVYVICAVLIVVGILLIVRYFMSGSFKDIREYGFSGGVLAIVAGFCVMIRSDAVAQAFGLFLGICILLTAVIKLQNAVDLNSMENRTWIVFLIIALAFMVASVWIIIDPFNWNKDSFDYIYYILVADGAVSLFSTIYMSIAIRMYEKWVAAGKPARKTIKDDYRPDTEDATEEKPLPIEDMEENGSENTEKFSVQDSENSQDTTNGSEVKEASEDDFPDDEEILKAVFSESDKNKQ